MTKKFYLVVMTVLLSVSLFVVGCEQDPEIRYLPANEDDEVIIPPEVVNPPPPTVVHYDVLVGSEGELRDALGEGDSAEVVAFYSALPVTFRSELKVTKPLYVFSQVSSDRKVTVESPVYVYTQGTLDVTNSTIGIGDAGSIEVFPGGRLVVSDAEAVNNGVTMKTVLGPEDGKVVVRGTLAINAESGAKIAAAVGYIEDGAALDVNASTLSPSKALSEISDVPAAGSGSVAVLRSAFGLSKAVTDLGTSNKTLAIRADAHETESALVIRKEVALSTIDSLDLLEGLVVSGTLTAPTATLASLTTLTVIASADDNTRVALTAPFATGNTTTGLKIDVGANATADFGTSATIAKIKDGSTVAGTLAVGNVITIENIVVSGGSAFAAKNVVNITKLELKAGAALDIVTVANIETPITVPAGATVNGTEYGSGSSTPISGQAGLDSPAVSDPTIGSDKTITVKAGTTYALAGKSTVKGTIEVPAGGTLDVPADGVATVEGDINVAGDFTVAGAVVNNGTITVSGTYTLSGAAAKYSGTGIVVVASGGRVAVAEGGAFAGSGTGSIRIASGGTVAIAEDGTFTGDSSNITGAGTFAFEAATLTGLDDQIGKAKDLGGDRTVVQLTAAFYTAANAATAALVIDAGETDNVKPYTIRGLGKTGTALTVGVLLANDYVTLEDVKIAVTDTAKAAPCSWENYKAAVSIGRAASGSTLLTGADLPSKNVTIRDCDISYTATTDFTAGVWVCGTLADNVIYPSTGITLSGNTVKATGNASSAVQALVINLWHPSITITDNTLDARYGTRSTTTPFYQGPASAIYISRVLPAGVTGVADTDVHISGNTLVASAYSFFFNTFQTVADPSDHSGVDVLRNDNFSVAETTWALSSATDQSSTYKKLFNALLANIRGHGFAYVSLPYSATAFESEQYEIQAGAVKAISVYGDHIVGGKYDGDSAGNKFNNASDTVGYDYGRKLADTTSNWASDTANSKYCFGPASDKLTTDGEYQYDTNFAPWWN